MRRPYRLIERRAITHFGDAEDLIIGTYATRAAAAARIVDIRARNPELAARLCIHWRGPVRTELAS